MSAAAPIYSLVDEARSRAESAAWAQFSSPRDRAEFCASWLAILCTQVERVSSALLLVAPRADEGFVPAAMWPDASRNLQYLGPTAQRALTERRGIVTSTDGERAPRADEPAYIGYPIEVSGVLYGAVVMHLAPSPEAELQRAMRLLHWASAWLVDQFRQQQLAQRDAQIDRLALASDLVATAVQERRFGASAIALVNELATRLHCERVSVGLEQGGSTRIEAISHTASFDRKTNLVSLIADAMDEVLDLDVALVHPPLEADGIAGLAHRELAAQSQHPCVCSVPLVDDGHAIGALTLERTQPFDAEALALCRTIGLMVGPILSLKRQNERGAWERLRESTRHAAHTLFGPGHAGAKLIALLALCALVLMSFTSGDYRVAAKTVLEGSVQRAAVAPFEGFIAESHVRAGDHVKKGQLLARIDDRNLQLEQLKWSSEVEQARRKLRQAAAAQDRAAMAIASAQVDQAAAQLALVEDKLERARLLAPFDGVVVSGDLSQLLGSPVEQGKVLFEIAPLNAYRVILNVDERDIADVQPGQKGELALSGIPYQTLPFAVKQVTPISVSQEGHNSFRVEAEIEHPSERLRPGMEGIGKVAVGERKLIWIWTHSLVDWFRLWAWKWMP
jgi:biotin carboxyl carrier protein